MAWHHKMRQLPGVTGLVAWHSGIFYDVRCPSSMLLAGWRQSGGRLYYELSFNCQLTFGPFRRWLISISGLEWLFIWTYFIKLFCVIKIFLWLSTNIVLEHVIWIIVSGHVGHDYHDNRLSIYSLLKIPLKMVQSGPDPPTGVSM